MDSSLPVIRAVIARYEPYGGFQRGQNYFVRVEKSLFRLMLYFTQACLQDGLEKTIS